MFSYLGKGIVIGGALWMGLASAYVFAGEPLLVSGSQKTPLLELYTSEGCSSCPAADQWLGSLKEKQGLWTEFVPIAFHVDYWDRLGWKDPLASTYFTQRQRAYARLWKSNRVYTPCFVFDGAEWNAWFGNREMPKHSASEGGVLQVYKVSSSEFRVEYDSADKKQKDWLAHAALIGFEVESNVLRGENRGQQFKHDFVTLAYGSGVLKNEGLFFNGHVKVESISESVPKRTGLAVWITPADAIRPVQATGGYLNKESI